MTKPAIAARNEKAPTAARNEKAPTAARYEKVPASALRFRAAVQFAKSAERPRDEEVPQPEDFDLTLRSGEPVDHPYWGQCVHDFAGMSAHKNAFPLDYCHDPKELVGTFDNIDASSGDLCAKGHIVPFSAADRASEILHRKDAGTPYEASIAFENPVVERVGENEQTTVNGRAFIGPLTVFRQWNLRGGALCPAGVDKYAHADFAAGDEPTTVTFLLKETKTMSQEQTAAADAGQTAVDEKGFWSWMAANLGLAGKGAPTASAAEPPPLVATSGFAAVGPIPAAAAGEDRKAEGQRFIAAFGAERGAAFFAEGLSYHEALAKHAAALAGEVETMKKRIAGAGLAEAVDQNGHLSFGEVKALSGGDAQTDAAAQLSVMQTRFGRNKGAFMAACCPPARVKS